MARLTYKTYSAKKEFSKIATALAWPIVTLAVVLFTISNFAAFGTRLICPFASVMWFAGFIVAIFLPQQREELIGRTFKMLIAYCGVLLLLKIAIGIASGVSSEMLAASFDQSITLSGGNILPMWVYVYVLPVAHFTLLIKTFLEFRRNGSLQRTFGRVRGIRKDNTNTRESKII